MTNSQVTTQTITLGSPALVRPPATAPNIGAVILQNLSPYQLAVQYLGDQYALAPYMSDYYLSNNTFGAPISLTPTDPNNNPPGLPAYVTATWYGPDDLPDATGFPATISPPAVAIGLAVAEQLLASGVPVPLQTTLIRSVTVHPGDGPPGVSIDVSAYASLLIVYRSGAADPVTLLFSTDAAGVNGVYLDQPSVGFQTPVYAQWVHFYDDALPGNVTFDVYGTNRVTTPAHPTNQGGAGNYSSKGFHGTTGSIAKIVGQTYDLNPDGLLFAGPAYMFFQSTGTTVGGLWRAIQADGRSAQLQDTALCGTASNGAKATTGLVALPGNLLTIDFFCTVAGTNTVSCWAIPFW